VLSLQARIFCFIIKNRHLLRFRLREETIDWNNSDAIAHFREEVDTTAGVFAKLPTGIEVSPLTIGNISAEWIGSSKAKVNKAILYFHGGGYVAGSCRTHRGIAAKFAKGSEVAALLFDYRKAPEYPFPAAHEDSLTVYRWLLAQGLPPAGIVFAGDSAGGGLCLATLLALRDQGLPLPAAAAVLSPVTDLKCTSDSYRTNAKRCVLPEGTGPALAKHYSGAFDPGLPYISPLYANLNGLPPILIYAGSDETLRDDSIRFAQKTKEAGGEITLRVGEGLFHCYPACAPFFSEAKEAMDEICAFIKAHIAGNGTAVTEDYEE